MRMIYIVTFFTVLTLLLLTKQRSKVGCSCVIITLKKWLSKNTYLEPKKIEKKIFFTARLIIILKIYPTPQPVNPENIFQPRSPYHRILAS